MNTLTQKFANIPVDEDTRITSEKIIQINGIDAMHQCWFWASHYPHLSPPPQQC